MVLSRAHDLNCITVYEGKNRNLTACHELLDNDLVTCSAEFTVSHHLFNSFLCLFLSLADNNTFTKSKAGCLYYDRHLCCL